MGLNQSWRHAFVTNSPALLAQGQTVETLGVGQIAILDEKTKTAVTAPTYATTKAFRFVWGTPDIEGRQSIMTGTPNENIYSKLVKGKNILGFRGKKAKRGQTQIVTVGFSGAAGDTDTLAIYPGEVRHLFLNLSGAPIDKFYTKQGLMRQYSVEAPYTADCGDDCVAVSAEWVADQLVKQINSDTQVNRFVKASKVIDAADPTPAANCYRFEVAVCDTRDDIALGLVQAQYPTDQVKRVRVEGANSVYEITRDANTTPTALSNSGFTTIPDCDVCPSGYVKEVAGFVYTAVVEDANADISATIVSKIDTAHATADAYAAKISNDNYVIVTQVELTPTQIETAIEASSGPAVSSVTFKYESTRDLCVQYSASTFAWSLAETLNKFSKKYRVTVADTVCGVNRLADIQAAFPDNVVTVVDASGDCVHMYEITVLSECVSAGCALADVKFVKPVPFEGVHWVEVPASFGNNKAGVRIESAFVNRITGECDYSHFTYEADPVHIYASSFDPNYNGDPVRAEWVAKQIQGIQYPAGHGVEIRVFEEDTKRDFGRHRSFDPVTRFNEGYEFITDPNRFYDEYVLQFKFDYSVGGWTQKESEVYSLFFYFPEGMGKSFEGAINAYIASVGLPIEEVIL